MSTEAATTAPERRALVEQLLRRKGIQRVVDPGIPRRRQFGPCELSFAQQRLWLMAQLNPRSAAFNIPVRLRLRGALDLEAVTFCLRALMARHEALRTSFAVIDGEPRQIVHQWLPAGALVVDLGAVAGDARERVASRVARQEARRVFDLSQAPLLRVTLIRQGADDHVVLLTMHHILSDGWSMGVLVREFSLLYAARTMQRPAALPPLPVQYADFALWQRARLRGDAFDRMVAHWKSRLADLPTTQLPTDRPKPPRRTGRSGSETIPLSPALASRLRDLSQRAGVTLFATWVAALNVWLHRYTGQRDLAIGVPIANRLRSELEGLIGFFVNQLVLRMKIAGHMSFDDVLNRAREVTLDAFAHQDMPFERLVEEIRPDRDAETTPLFQVAFAFHNTPTPSLELPGLQVEPVAGGTDATRFDLELHVRDTGDRLGGVLYYDRDLFEPATIVRMLGHLTAIIEGACQDSSRPISELPFLTEAERGQILEWNDTRAEWESRSVLDLIDAQAARTPHLTAVVCEDGTWIYQELQDQANRIARWLRGIGVEPGTLVGIWMERSRHAVAALLATLKAGAAYVPLDPGCPPTRLAAQLEDAGVTVLLTDRHRVASAPAGPYVVHAIDDVRGPWLAEKMTAPPVPVHPDSLAYVIYTSGSTGQPKGVMVTHRGLLNYLCWARETYPLEEGQGTLFHSSLAFDLSVTSVLAPLVAGSTIHVVSERNGLDGLTQAFRKTSDLGFVKATPAHLRALGDALPPAELAGRARAFVVGGEALDAALVDRWLTNAPATHIFNEYGPTETVVGCSVQELVAGQPLSDPVPIGRPIANTQLYVVTSHGQLAPVGVAGELWIGGAGVARGYLGRPDITAARFVPDPFSAVPGARVYRSGDIARYRPDGTLEYLGRLDHQVKVRGYRIEPGEIEGVLTQHPAVAAAVVVARRDPERGASLAAYVVAHDESVVSEKSEPLVQALSEYLSAMLPDYLVPASITVLPAFPLAASGKVDRGALPAPHARRVASPSAAPPQTPVEEMLAGIWINVLGIDHVGVDENFFELGGHSLLATQVVSRVRDAFGVDLPFRALFDAPTIARLAERLTAISAGTVESHVPKLAPAPRVELMPLSFAQQRLWFLHCLDPHSAFYNVPFALRMRGPVSIPVVQRCIETIVGRHEVLRTRFALDGERPVQRIETVGEVPLPVVSLEALPEARRTAAAQRLAGEEARRPYDLASDPVFRISVLRLAADDHVVLFTLHHIVSDAWSVGVLIRELSALYHAFTTDGRMPLPPLPLQYADFAVWQRRWLTDAVLERHLDYWRQQLGDVIGQGELFPRRTRAGRPSRRRGLHPMSVSPEVTQGLRGLSRRHQATLFMTLLAAFDVVLHAETGQSRFVVGTDVANRRDARLESLVGFFVNRLVLKADVSRDDPFEKLLAQVRGVTLGAYDHQDLPFERLVEALRPARDAGRYPLFQVLFVLQNTPSAMLTLPGLDVQSFPVDRRETTADLILTMTEQPGGLSGLFEFDVDLFEQATVVELATKLVTVIDEVVKDAHVPVGALAERLGQVDRAVQRTKRQSYAAALDRSLRHRKRGPS